MLSQQMEIDIDNGKVTGLKVLGGCSGNLQGIAKLVEGHGRGRRHRPA